MCNRLLELMKNGYAGIFLFYYSLDNEKSKATTETSKLSQLFDNALTTLFFDIDNEEASILINQQVNVNQWGEKIWDDKFGKVGQSVVD